jgi:hypothetical protein
MMEIAAAYYLCLAIAYGLGVATGLSLLFLMRKL